MSRRSADTNGRMAPHGKGDKNEDDGPSAAATVPASSAADSSPMRIAPPPNARTAVHGSSLAHSRGRLSLATATATDEQTSPMLSFSAPGSARAVASAGGVVVGHGQFLSLTSLERGVSISNSSAWASSSPPAAVERAGGGGSGASSPASSYSSQQPSGRSSAMLDSECRPSPQLLAAMNGSAVSPRMSQSSDENANTAPPQQLQSRFATAGAAGGAPLQLNVAGRMPPSFALEKPALPDPSSSSFSASRAAAAAVAAASTFSNAASSYWQPQFASSSQYAQPRRADYSPATSSGPSTPPIRSLSEQQQQHVYRARSMSGPGQRPTGLGFAANLTPPIGAAALARRAMLMRQSYDGLQLLQLQQAHARAAAEAGPLDEESEDQSLLLPSSSAAAAAARALRNRAHSNPTLGLGLSGPVAPLLSDEDGSSWVGGGGAGGTGNGGAWSSKTSRAILYCASGILFVLILAFFSVVALRMAAHAHYDDRQCVLRAVERQKLLDKGISSPVLLPHEVEDERVWKPNYDFQSWDVAKIEGDLKAQWLRARGEEEADGVVEEAEEEGGLSAAESAAMDARARAMVGAGAWLSSLRLNHFKVMGTHNSFHLASSLPLSMHQYTHPPLPQQLDSYRRGIRQLELDLHIIRKRESSSESSSSDKPSMSSEDAATVAASSADSFLVYHLQWIDDKTSCYCLSECLDLIARWSASHPSHFPIYLTFEIKSRLWEDVDTGLRGVTCRDLENVEREVLAVLPRDKLVTPLQVRGGEGSPHKTVKQALRAAADLELGFANALEARRLRAAEKGVPLEMPDPSEYPSAHPFGWPRLTDALGKVVLVWLDDMHNLADTLDCTVQVPQSTSPSEEGSSTSAVIGNVTSSTAAAPSVAVSLEEADWFHAPNRLLFVAQNSLEAPYASVVTAKYPLTGMDSGVLTRARELGMLVRTMTGDVDVVPDPARFAAALHSGAHMLSTDFEECIPRAAFKEEDSAAAPSPLPPTPTPTEGQPSTGGKARKRPRKFKPQEHVNGNTHVHFAASLAQSIAALFRSPSSQSSASRALMQDGSASSSAAAAPSSVTTLANVGSTSGGGSQSVGHYSPGDIYCEHLESEWPFECNDLSAPFFCTQALEAVRMQKELFEHEQQQKRQKQKQRGKNSRP